MAFLNSFSQHNLTTGWVGAVKSSSSPSVPAVPLDVATSRVFNWNPRAFRTYGSASSDLSPGYVNVTYVVYHKKKIPMGTRNVTRRRYRWVNGRNGAYKQYYIALVTKTDYVTIDVPKIRQKRVKIPRLTNQDENCSSGWSTWLPPNPLEYNWIDDQFTGSSGDVHIEANTGEYYSYKTTSQDLKGLEHHSFLPTMTRITKTSLKNAMPSISDQRPPGFPYLKYSEIYFDLRKQLDKESLFKCYTKVADDYPNVAMMIAELPQSVKMVSSILNKGMKLIRNLKKAQLHQTKDKDVDRQKSMADTWLMWTYGINPILGDLEKTIALESNKFKFNRSYTASAEAELFKNSPMTAVSGAIVCEHELSYSVASRKGITVAVEQDSSIRAYKQMLDLLGFGAPAGTAYEMLPLSFVVDWAVPIGDFLNSRDILRNYTVRAHWTTNIIRENVFSKYSLDNQRLRSLLRTNPTYIGFKTVSAAFAPSIVKYERVFVERKVPAGSLPEMPDPFVMVNRLGLSVRRQISALALLVQRRK